MEKLPEFSKRIQQNFKDLVINANGFVEGEDCDDEYVNGEDTEKLLIEDEILPNFRQKRKRKTTEENEKTTKKTKTSKQPLSCEICSVSFSRKDNLSRHVRNKHG